MVTKVIIKENDKAPIKYLPDLDNFQNGMEYEFKEGVNIIVGENGSGKTTLLNLIRHYLLVDFNECSLGTYSCNINRLFSHDGFLDGVDVYADYKKNTFRLSHAGEKEQNTEINTFEEFGSMVSQKNSSTGESVLISINFLFKLMFSEGAKLVFDYEQDKLKERYPEYIEYVKGHRVEGDEYTILMDEPDRNLSIENLKQIKSILSFHKPNTQIICVIHNPLLIYALSNIDDINIIEMSRGYVRKIKREINKLLS